MINMNRRSLFFSTIAIVAVSVGAYIAVPIILDGPFPQRTSSKLFFDRHHDGLESLYQQLNEDGLSRVMCYPDSVRAGTEPKGPGQLLTGDNLSTYLALCGEASTTTGWRTENGFLFYLGGAGNDLLEFNIALIRLGAEPSVAPDCESLVPSGDFGKCQFELDSAWRLDYEWYSRKYIDSFSEDES